MKKYPKCNSDTTDKILFWSIITIGTALIFSFIVYNIYKYRYDECVGKLLDNIENIHPSEFNRGLRFCTKLIIV